MSVLLLYFLTVSIIAPPTTLYSTALTYRFGYPPPPLSAPTDFKKK
jgi:hypothetical protein